MVRLLLSAGCDVMRKDARGMTALMHAASQASIAAYRRRLIFVY
jgi:hypothetical protein